jgi:hypothetical protein
MTRPAFWVQFTPAAGLNRAQNDQRQPIPAFWVQFTPTAGLNRAQFDGAVAS